MLMIFVNLLRDLLNATRLYLFYLDEYKNWRILNIFWARAYARERKTQQHKSLSDPELAVYQMQTAMLEPPVPQQVPALPCRTQLKTSKFEDVWGFLDFR